MPPKAISTTLTLIPALLIALVGTCLADYLLLNHDVAFFLDCARRLLHGERLYEDFIDYNTPMIMLLSAVPVLLHGITGLPLPELSFASAFVLMWCAFWLATTILRAHPAFVRRPAVAGIGFAILSYGLFLFPNTSRDFGQRELLMCALVFPYIALTLNRFAGVSHSPCQTIAAGILAGIGLCLKPQFLLLFLAVEAYSAWETRSLHFHRRLEALLIFCILILYYFCMLIYVPEYFFVLVPNAHITVSVYQSPLAAILFTAMLFAALGFGCMLFMPRQSPHRRGMYLLGELVLAAAIIFIVEKCNYGYHLMPEIFFILLLLVFIASDSARRVVSMIILAIACAFMFFLSGGMRIKPAVENLADQRKLILDLAEAIRPYDSAIFFSGSVSPGFPAVIYAGTRWGLDYACVCYIASAYEKERPPLLYQAPVEMAPQLRYFQDIAMKDIARLPAAIVINQSFVQQAMPPHFDFVAHFMKDPRFLPLWAHYRTARMVIDGSERFAIYERAD